MRVRLDAEAIEAAIHRELHRQYPGATMARSAQLRLASLAAEIAMQGAWMHVPQDVGAAQDRSPGWEAA